METDSPPGTRNPNTTGGESARFGQAWPGQSARNGASAGSSSERSRWRAFSARPVNAPSESMVHYTEYCRSFGDVVYSKLSRQRERPLVVRCGAFGDMVLITSLISDLNLRFGSEVDILTSGPWSEPLLTGQPGVGDILCVRSRKTPYWLSLDQQRAVHRLRSRGVSPTWFCDGSDAARPMLVRAGFRDEFIVDVKDHPLLPGEHATQQWRRLARILPAAGWPGLGPSGTTEPSGGTGSSGGCHVDVSDAQRADLEAWLRARGLSSRPLIAVQAGNKRTMRRGLRRLAVNSKYWPNERWAVVLRHLRARNPSHAIVLLGAGPEFVLNQEIMACAGVDGLYNAADDLPMPR